MDYKKLGLGLGALSIGLGLAGVFAPPGGLRDWLGVEGKTRKASSACLALANCSPADAAARARRIDQCMEPRGRRCDGSGCPALASPCRAATARALSPVRSASSPERRHVDVLAARGLATGNRPHLPARGKDFSSLRERPQYPLLDSVHRRDACWRTRISR